MRQAMELADRVEVQLCNAWKTEPFAVDDVRENVPMRLVALPPTIAARGLTDVQVQNW